MVLKVEGNIEQKITFYDEKGHKLKESYFTIKSIENSYFKENFWKFKNDMQKMAGISDESC